MKFRGLKKRCNAVVVVDINQRYAVGPSICVLLFLVRIDGQRRSSALVSAENCSIQER